MKTKKGTKKELSQLQFLGTKARAPIKLENVTIYTCPNSSSWRVKKNDEKKDKAFSWKANDPETTWARVVAHVKKLGVK